MNLHFRALCSLAQIKRISSLLALMLVLFQVHTSVVDAQTPGKEARTVVRRVEPEYPDFFRNGHFQGRVVAEATVLPNGSVSHVEIKSGNPMFAEFASKALMKWKYAAGPVQTVEDVTFHFSTTPH
jgi:outer membrane biosynthesis protein TonB